MSHPLHPNSETSSTAEPTGERGGVPSRLFLFDTGWHAEVKANSLREFCTSMTPGQDYYHTLLANEIYVHQGTEKLCLPCAIRRGIVLFEPRRLRDVFIAARTAVEDIPLDIDLGESGQTSDEPPTAPPVP
jgi:hypothetical protein